MDYAVRLFIHRDIQEAKAFVILFVSVDTPPPFSPTLMTHIY